MFCSSSNPAQRRFVTRMWIAAGLSVLFAMASALAFRFGHLAGVLAYPVAILPALPIVGTLVLTGTYLAEETDEFQRNLLVQSLLGGIGVTLAATTIAGYLERFMRTPHLDPVLWYPVFWFSTAASYAVIWRRYR